MGRAFGWKIKKKSNLFWGLGWNDPDDTEKNRGGGEGRGGKNAKTLASGERKGKKKGQGKRRHNVAATTKVEEGGGGLVDTGGGTEEPASTKRGTLRPGKVSAVKRRGKGKKDNHPARENPARNGPCGKKRREALTSQK